MNTANVVSIVVSVIALVAAGVSAALSYRNGRKADEAAFRRSRDERTFDSRKAIYKTLYQRSIQVLGSIEHPTYAFIEDDGHWKVDRDASHTARQKNCWKAVAQFSIAYQEFRFEQSSSSLRQHAQRLRERIGSPSDPDEYSTDEVANIAADIELLFTLMQSDLDATNENRKTVHLNRLIRASGIFKWRAH